MRSVIRINKHPTEVTVEEIENLVCSLVGERIIEHRSNECETYCHGAVVVHYYKTESGRTVEVEEWHEKIGELEPCVIIRVY